MSCTVEICKIVYTLEVISREYFPSASDTECTIFPLMIIPLKILFEASGVLCMVGICSRRL